MEEGIRAGSRLFFPEDDAICGVTLDASPVLGYVHTPVPAAAATSVNDVHAGVRRR
jgi:hypothetical protein